LVDDPVPEPDTIVTILGNLVDNAIDAAAGGPTPRQVTIRLHAGDELTIEVADTGPGVPEEARDATFNDGFSTKQGDNGRRGLGLAIVHREVRRLGGDITFTNGPGATFTVVLPIPVELAGARP